MRWGWSLRNHQLAINDLANHVVGQSKQIRIRRGSLLGQSRCHEKLA
jgi:hypothetical protein